LILGAGPYQVPLIKIIKKNGFKTIVATSIGNYPGIDVADCVEYVDTTDTDGILEISKKYSIDSILTTGTDVAIPSIGLVVDKLKLNGTGYNSSLLSMNKILMKKKFRE